VLKPVVGAAGIWVLVGGTCITVRSWNMLDFSQAKLGIELLRENFECFAAAAFILVHFPLECPLSVLLSVRPSLFR
jgi:hypothetical protein